MSVVRFQKCKVHHQECKVRHQKSIVRYRMFVVRSQKCKVHHQECKVRYQKSIVRHRMSVVRFQKCKLHHEECKVRYRKCIVDHRISVVHSTGHIRRGQIHSNSDLRPICAAALFFFKPHPGFKAPTLHIDSHITTLPALNVLKRYFVKFGYCYPNTIILKKQVLFL